MLRNSSEKYSMSFSRKKPCPYGIKKSGVCKKKPGAKKGSRKSSRKVSRKVSLNEHRHYPV